MLLCGLFWWWWWWWWIKMMMMMMMMMDKDDDNCEDKFTSCWLQKKKQINCSWLVWVCSRFSSILLQVLPRYPPPPVYLSTQNPTLKNSSLIWGVQTLLEAAFKSPLMYVDILYSVNHSILTNIDVIVIFFNLESWLQTSVRIFIRGCPSILCSLR